MKLSSAPPTLSAPESLNQTKDAKPTIIESKLHISDSGKLEKPTQEPSQNFSKGALAVFGSTFLTIFLSEMGDKTQVATLLMSAESQSPWLVFAGASSALIATSLLGVLLGRWLATKVSPQILNKAAGISMLVITMQLVWEIFHS
ncbi:TMEM165/GDT1 family protein [Aerosakkonemataceae cyanobacterium BLCC-F154]|uniref:GDT1 family protein n=1 Tax=Floridaenema fluviatile BLCC-F154 TaxID=3153640 RepID=A0ABV4YA45_9CYAN